MRESLIPLQVNRTKEEAQRLANRLLRQVRRNPDNFETLARNNSDGPSKSLGGDLGFFRRNHGTAIL